VRFPAPPRRTRPPWDIRTPKRPFLPVWGRGVGGISQGEIFGEAPACHLPFQAAGRPDSPCSPCGSRGRGDRTGQERAPCAVRAPPARTRAGRPRTRRNPQAHALAGAGLVASPGVPARCARLRRARGRNARAPGATLRCVLLQGQVWWQAPACHLPFQAAGRPDSPFAPCGEGGRGDRTGADFLASPGVPSFVSGSRTPRLPLLPLWEKGAGGMRGQMRTGMLAHLRQERAPCTVRAPPARTQAGRPRTRRNPQAHALAGAGLVASPGVPSFVSGIRTPRLPLLPLWEKGVGGMRGKCARECWRTPQVHTPLQGQVGWQTVRLYKRSQGLRVHTPLQGQVGWQAPACHLPFQAAGRPNTPFCLCGDEGLGKSHRGRFLGKPRRAIFRFRHQDAQTPPSPLVG
jgi:hypothetical protein